VTPAVMVDMLHRAGAPAEAEEIGVGRDYLRRTTLNARFLRSRYTVLDLLDECGMLGAAVEASLPAVQRREGRA
jgi:glycerol-1-phosphate dehydrogenase [NAD(P)+]